MENSETRKAIVVAPLIDCHTRQPRHQISRQLLSVEALFLLRSEFRVLSDTTRAVFRACLMKTVGAVPWSSPWSSLCSTIRRSSLCSDQPDDEEVQPSRTCTQVQVVNWYYRWHLKVTCFLQTVNCSTHMLSCTGPRHSSQASASLCTVVLLHQLLCKYW